MNPTLHCMMNMQKLPSYSSVQITNSGLLRLLLCQNIIERHPAGMLLMKAAPPGFKSESYRGADESYH